MFYLHRVGCEVCKEQEGWNQNQNWIVHLLRFFLGLMLSLLGIYNYLPRYNYMVVSLRRATLIRSEASFVEKRKWTKSPGASQLSGKVGERGGLVGGPARPGISIGHREGGGQGMEVSNSIHPSIKMREGGDHTGNSSSGKKLDGSGKGGCRDGDGVAHF